MPSILSFDRVTKSYPQAGGAPRTALDGATFSLPAGSVTALVGRSGSGKTTLLNLASGIDVPTSGRVLLDGNDLGALSEHRRTLLRRATVGIVFQFFHLLPHLSVRDNVALPEWIDGKGTPGIRDRVRDLLERVGLADREGDTIQKLSGGEMQRVALCRALIRRPRLLLADEPTGNLDDDNARLVMDILLRLSEEEGSALLYVTHSREMAARAGSLRTIHSGILEPA